MSIPPGLAEAARLTRSGDLAGATALIQSLLGGHASPPAPAAPAPPPIDLTAERVTFAPARPHAVPPAGGTMQAAHYRGAAGTLAYRLYVPADARPGMPLVVMLHGCTQGPEDFARGTGMNALADAHGFVVAWPEQPAKANQQRCWNWFRAADQRRDSGEPALMAGMTRAIIADHGIDPSRVYIAGLSAGGAAAAIMTAEYPDLYAAAGIHSGLPHGAARTLPGALTAMQKGGAAASLTTFVPVITFHGDADHTVTEANARAIVDAATRAAPTPLDVTRDEGNAPGGRRFTRAVSRDATGRAVIEQWTVHGAGHAWFGGKAAGSYTDAFSPDASAEMLRFFLTHRLPATA